MGRGWGQGRYGSFGAHRVLGVVPRHIYRDMPHLLTGVISIGSEKAPDVTIRRPASRQPTCLENLGDAFARASEYDVHATKVREGLGFRRGAVDTTPSIVHAYQAATHATFPCQM